MSNPFLAEIRMFGFNFAPYGWALCDGQLLPISQNAALFSLVGTYYGGNGQTSFGLPNLQGRCPVNSGQGTGLSLYQLGEMEGQPTVSLSDSEIPAHSHNFMVHDLLPPAPDAAPAPNEVLGHSNGGPAYVDPAPATLQALNTSALSFTGGGSAHNNMMPYLVVNFCIALQGVFPQRQ
ncbi:MAG TPA: tail fiber protein [Chthoniobacter sp.]|jgi:microcystin-dependent protein